MPEELPLPAALSAAFVAFTIEVDNEAECKLPHMTTSFGATGKRGAVWLTSLAMWFNCLRGLADVRELTVGGLERAARMSTNLDGMRRWGYITIDGVGRVRRGAKRPQAKPGSVLALTDRGRAADAIWRPLPAAIERRWRDRFGADAINRLRAALVAVARQINAPLPDFMPIGSVNRSVDADSNARDAPEREADANLPLVSLLARVLMQFTLDYERASPLRLAFWSNLIRVLDAETAAALGELPQLTGVSKEAVAMFIGRLEQAGCVVVEPLSATGRGRQARLTAERGARARKSGRRQIDAIVDNWQQRYGTDVTPELTSALVPIVGDGTRSRSPLFAGIEPRPEGWRARVRPPRLLPWYPMVLHRGGYPDGS
jgi:DNA-binding MarR family transcriptional regulator